MAPVFSKPMAEPLEKQTKHEPRKLNVNGVSYSVLETGELRPAANDILEFLFHQNDDSDGPSFVELVPSLNVDKESMYRG